jgi:uncharacterized protein
MNAMTHIVTSKIFYISIIAWIIAQGMKVLIYYFRYHKINFRLFVGSGGMPSSHSTLVSCLATTIGLEAGWNSPVFLLALGMAMVIMTDAAGVRRAAGQQAKILNEIMDNMSQSKPFSQQRLKELIGHTPVQVLVGAFIGVVVGLALYSL